MRWKAKPYRKNGDTREVSRFCLWPNEIDGYWYWLEWVHIHQVLRITARGGAIWHDIEVTSN